MAKRRRVSRKRIVIAYTLRTLTVCFLGLILFLCVCGCLYIHEHLHMSTEQKIYVKSGQVYAAEDENAHENVQTKEKSYDGYRIILDAGHGGNDVGTNGGKIYEKDINLTVVQKMQAILEEKNVEVILTRDSDVYVGLIERSKIANENQGDLFVSIHCNQYEKDSSIRGFEVYYHSSSDSSKEIAEEIIDYMDANSDITVRTAQPQNYSVLRNTQMPAILVELGFMSNSTDLANLTSDTYTSALAEKLVDSILNIDM